MLQENFTYDFKLTYLGSPDGIFAVAKSTSSGYRLHYVHTDNLGSWDIITDENGHLEQSLSFDAWGNRRDATTWNGLANDTPLFDRGFTGHEHLYNFGLINMNGRVYDPYMSTFLSPDNYIQCPDNSQNFNRYAYCLNNPLKYTDPDGESFTAAVLIIGATVGIYTGGVLANNSYNPLKWDYSSRTTWSYMLCGGLTGLASAGAGLAVAATDIMFCNTLGMIAASTVNSAGMYLYTDGKTDFTISCGIASYNFSKKEWGYLLKKDNSILQNIGYGLGGLYNALDVCRFFTWDILSYKEKFSKLENYANSHKKEFGDITMEYKGANNHTCGDFDPNNNHIYIYDEALSKGWGWAKSTLCHEVKHKFDYVRAEHEKNPDTYYNLLDYQAYGFEVQTAKYNGLSLRQYNQVINNCYYNANIYGLQYLPQFPNYNFKIYWSWLKNSFGY